MPWTEPNLESFTLERLCAELCEDRFGYHKSYFNLIKVVQSLAKNPTEENACGIAYMAYGWMPTTLKSVNFSEELGGGKGVIKGTLNVKNACDRLTFLKGIGNKSPINSMSKGNGSWVGFSKFLHFLNPEMFPIWDSRVAELFGYNHYAQYNKADVYQEYVAYIHQNKELPIVKRAKHLVAKKAGNKPTKVRSAELLLFTQNPRKTDRINCGVCSNRDKNP